MNQIEKEEKLKMLQEHQMRMLDLQKIEDPDERNRLYESLPELNITPDEIHSIYSDTTDDL
jgi:hypothetical protein